MQYGFLPLFQWLCRGNKRMADDAVAAGKQAGHPDAADGHEGGDGGVFVFR